MDPHSLTTTNHIQNEQLISLNITYLVFLSESNWISGQRQYSNHCIPFFIYNVHIPTALDLGFVFQEHLKQDYYCSEAA